MLEIVACQYGNANNVHACSGSDQDWTGEEYTISFANTSAFSDELARSSCSQTRRRIRRVRRVRRRERQRAAAVRREHGAEHSSACSAVHPQLGRAFDANDGRPRSATRRSSSAMAFSGRTSAARGRLIGHQILLDGETVTVIGVMPRGFSLPTPETHAWRPLRLDPAEHDVQESGT